MNQAWAERWAKVFTMKQKAGLEQIYHSDLDFEDVAFGHKAASFAEFWSWYEAAADIAGAEHIFTARRWVGDASGGAIEWTWIGKHGVDLNGIPLKGKTTLIEGVSVVRLRDGKIYAERDFWSLASLMKQAGALPDSI